MEILIVAVFVLGYIAIAFEHQFKVNKAASALVTAGLCWSIYMVSSADKELVTHQLHEHLAGIAEILFFLLGAMTIVELIDAHDGFQVIVEKIKTNSYKKLLWIVCLITFFLSAILDNLTTTIVLVSLVRKIVHDREKKLLFIGMVIIAANAGGAWSPIGDITTTMLWIGKQITAGNIILKLFIPSLVCLVIPVWIVSRQLKGKIGLKKSDLELKNQKWPTTLFERNFVFRLGIGMLIGVPILKTTIHLPPYLAMLLGLGMMWIITEFVHSGKDTEDKDPLTVVYALRKIDTPSILFFLGILISIGALEVTGQLKMFAIFLDSTIHNETISALIIGLASAVVDNVPLVAATQGMYSLEQYPTDHYFWEFLAYATGTGGSTLIIGSAAGVAAMGLEQIDFFWYLKKIAWLALIGYLSGAFVYIIGHQLL